MPTESTADQSVSGAQTVSDIAQDESYILNLKRLSDEFTDIGLARARADAQLAQRMANAAFDHDQQLRQAALHTITGSGEIAKLAGMNGVEAAKVGSDRTWNPDEVAQLTTITSTVLAAVLAKLNDSGQE